MTVGKTCWAGREHGAGRMEQGREEDSMEEGDRKREEEGERWGQPL